MLAISQEKQHILTLQYQQNMLPHAIIIQGQTGSGSEALAHWLIELLICQQPQLSGDDVAGSNSILRACGQCKSCLLQRSHTYPDTLLLEVESKTLGVDDIRRSNSFLEKTAQLGRFKTVLIPDAENMTVAAANALLKTLEEPSENSFIVLLAKDLDSLLPTVISRCAVHSIRSQVGQALLNELSPSSQSFHNAGFDKSAYANISQLAELTDETLLAQFLAFEQSVMQFFNRECDEGVIYSVLTENPHGMRWLESIVCQLIRDENTLQNKVSYEDSHAGNGKTNYAPNSVLFQGYQAIIHSNKLIKSYAQANRQFVVEKLVMSLSDITSIEI